MITYLDTSVLVGALLQEHPQHENCTRALNGADNPHALFFPGEAAEQCFDGVGVPIFLFGKNLNDEVIRAGLETYECFLKRFCACINDFRRIAEKN